MPRIRIRHTKNTLLQYTGTLDIQKLWERTFRRAKLPIAYSQGFHPQPKIQLACPLPLGMTSSAEFVDFWLEKAYELDELQEKIEAVKHAGVDILDIQLVDEREPALQSRLESTLYQIRFGNKIDRFCIEQKINEMLSRPELVIDRRGRNINIRPLIEDCRLVTLPDGGALLHIQLSARPGATGRPEEVLKVLGIDINQVHIERTEILFSPLPGT